MKRHRRLPVATSSGSAFSRRGLWYSMCWSDSYSMSFCWSRGYPWASNGDRLRSSTGARRLQDSFWYMTQEDMEFHNPPRVSA